MKQQCLCGANCPISCIAWAAKFKTKNEAGKRYGKLTVVKQEDSRCWLTQCDCGGFRIAKGTELRAGRLKACKPCARQTQGYHKVDWEKEAA